LPVFLIGSVIVYAATNNHTNIPIPMSSPTAFINPKDKINVTKTSTTILPVLKPSAKPIPARAFDSLSESLLKIHKEAK
jgi:hypothetical protein